MMNTEKPTLYATEKAMAEEIEVCATWKDASKMIVYVLEHATFHEFRQQAIDAMGDMARLADEMVEKYNEHRKSNGTE